jgi:hypothetical protein
MKKNRRESAEGNMAYSAKRRLIMPVTAERPVSGRGQDNRLGFVNGKSDPGGCVESWISEALAYVSTGGSSIRSEV